MLTLSFLDLSFCGQRRCMFHPCTGVLMEAWPRHCVWRSASFARLRMAENSSREPSRAHHRTAPRGQCIFGLGSSYCDANSLVFDDGNISAREVHTRATACSRQVYPIDTGDDAILCIDAVYRILLPRSGFLVGIHSESMLNAH